MTFTKEAEKQDNENYSKNFTRIANIIFASYKYLSKEEKFLYCTLRQIYWDMKPRFATVRELSHQTGYSPSALCKMLPRLHTCGLIHSEVRKEKGKDGKEKGNAKYHITIPDIWELNRQFFACSPQEQEKMDPSLKLVRFREQVSVNPVHENEQACSPNNTRLFTKTNKPVLFREQTQAQLERAKDSIKDTLKKDRKKEEPTSSDPESSSHSFTHSLKKSSLSSETKQELTQEKIILTEDVKQVYDLACEQLFQAEPPEVTAAMQGHCAKIAKHVKNKEQMASLIAFTRKEQHLEGKTVYFGNLARGLNGWLQTERLSAAVPSPVASSVGKATTDMLAAQEAAKQRILEKEAAQGGRGPSPLERAKLLAKQKFLEGKAKHEAAIARGENPL